MVSQMVDFLRPPSSKARTLNTRPVSDMMAVGITMMLAANFLFATLDTTVKWLLTLGLPALQLAFFRYAGHFVISCAGVLRTRDWDRLRGGGKPGSGGRTRQHAGAGHHRKLYRADIPAADHHLGDHVFRADLCVPAVGAVSG